MFLWLFDASQLGNDIKFYLEDLLKTPVDLVLNDALKKRLRPYITQEVVYA